MGFINMPTITKRTPDDQLVPTARIALNGLDQWAQEAHDTLVGRKVVYIEPRARPYSKGSAGIITDVAVGAGASGYHLFVTLRLIDGTRRTARELGVDCELIAADDVRSADI